MTFSCISFSFTNCDSSPWTASYLWFSARKLVFAGCDSGLSNVVVGWQTGLSLLLSENEIFYCMYTPNIIDITKFFNRLVIRAFTHGAMGCRIDPSWSGPIELFLILASAPQLVQQRLWYVLSCLWDDAYKRTLAANRSFTICLTPYNRK